MPRLRHTWESGPTELEVESLNDGKRSVTGND
jgi:hypothetical protein